MTVFLAILLCVAFWAWVASMIGLPALLCVVGILVCLIMLGTGEPRGR